MASATWKTSWATSLPSRGAWIEICSTWPHGTSNGSLPSRGAWIEISSFAGDALRLDVAPLAGSVDRNSRSPRRTMGCTASLPSRGAWIEIRLLRSSGAGYGVAPLAGSVDRNKADTHFIGVVGVAPLAGSVDRNRIAVKNGRDDLGRSPRGERG